MKEWFSDVEQEAAQNSYFWKRGKQWGKSSDCLSLLYGEFSGCSAGRGYPERDSFLELRQNQHSKIKADRFYKADYHRGKSCPEKGSPEDQHIVLLGFLAIYWSVYVCPEPSKVRVGGGAEHSKEPAEKFL